MGVLNNESIGFHTYKNNLCETYVWNEFILYSDEFFMYANLSNIMQFI